MRARFKPVTIKIRDQAALRVLATETRRGDTNDRAAEKLLLRGIAAKEADEDFRAEAV